LLSFKAISQDEMSQEIDKLQSGDLETKESVVPQDPTESASQVEEELDKEMKPNKPSASPTVKSETEELQPEDNAQEEIQETPAPEVEEAPKAAQKAKPAPAPAPENNEETLQPVEEDVVHKEEPVEPPPAETLPAEEPTQPAVAENQEESVPDDFEQRINRIYNKFYAEATSDTAWTQIAGEKINETYTIQPGDTLWDISETFFGNGHYWPKVWQMNDDITNPHLISPGYVLRFTPGKIDAAPQVNISQNGTPPATTPAPGAAANEPKTAKMEAVPVIPPPEKKYVPVLKNLPPSLPYISGPKFTGFDRDGFSQEVKKPQIEEARVFLSSYLSEEEPDRLGKVVETDDEDIERGMLYDNVYIRFDDPVNIGDRFLTYHLGDKIYDFNGHGMGKPIVLEGEIQITQQVNDKKNVYQAKVLRNVNFVQVGSYVMKGRLVEGNTAMTNDTASVSAEIVGGDFDNDRRFTAAEEEVFLNKGANAGIKEGQIFEVYKNMEARKDSTYIRNLKDKVARIKIIKTTPERSTGIIIGSSQEVRSGDFIGAKEVARNDEIKDFDFDAAQENSNQNSDEMDNSDQSGQDSDSQDDLNL
jgi:nucleoid-associated protein YgaU